MTELRHADAGGRRATQRRNASDLDRRSTRRRPITTAPAVGAGMPQNALPLGGNAMPVDAVAVSANPIAAIEKPPVAARFQTPQRAIRARCLDCRESRTEVENCEFGPGRVNACPLHQFRVASGKRAGSGSRLKAIRAYCLWCCCGSCAEVTACGTHECSLHPYRYGKRPKSRSAAPSPEQEPRQRQERLSRKPWTGTAMGDQARHIGPYNRKES